MQYSQFQSIKDIFSFSVNGTQVAYCTKSGNVVVCDSSSLKVEWSKGLQNPSEVVWYEDVLYARDNRGHGENYFFTNNGNPIDEFNQKEIRYSIDRFSNMVSGRVVCFIEYNDIRKLGLLNISERKFLWTYDGEFFISLQAAGFVFAALSSEKDGIMSLSALNGKFLWQLNLANMLPRPNSVYLNESRYQFKFSKFVGVYSNKLIVSVTWDPATNRLLSINCDTGLLDHYWSDLELKTAHHAQQILTGPNVLFLHGYNKIEKETQFAEINIESGNIVRAGILESLIQLGLILKDWTFNDDKIFFTALRDERFPTHIGILDYKNFDLLWWQKIEMANNAFLVQGKGPTVHKDQLYVLDTEGALHFFKRVL